MSKKEPILVYENKADKILIEKVYSFNANLTLGLDEFGDYYLKICFIDLDKSSFEKLIELGNLNKRLEFTSEIIQKEKYNISHIVVGKYLINAGLNITWECLSDDPSIYEGLDGKL